MRDTLIRTLTAAVLLATALATAPTAEAAPKNGRGVTAFDAGVKAYRAGSYQQALGLFLKARQQGMQHPNLDLNLGLTYYQLGRYEESRSAFTRLRHDLRYMDIADYHLGLVAARMGERDDAIRYLGSAEYLTASSSMRELASLALDRLDEEHPGSDVSGEDVRLYLRAATGYDSNPELNSDDEQLPGEDLASGFVGMLADMEVPLGASVLGTTAAQGAVDLRQHFSDEGFDQQGAEIGLRQRWRGLGWRFGLTGEAGGTWLEGDPFQNTGGAALDARRELGRTAFVLRGGSERISGGEGFEYLDGWRHRVEAQAGRPLGPLRGRLKYEFERNDRRDRELAPEFTSYSPTRHGLGAWLAMPRWRALSSELRAGFRASDYRGEHRFDDGTGTIVTEARDDRLLSAGVRLRLQQRQSWNWLVDLSLSRNTSSIEHYEYSRQLLQVGVEFLR